jgi:hypothetical protein
MIAVHPRKRDVAPGELNLECPENSLRRRRGIVTFIFGFCETAVVS